MHPLPDVAAAAALFADASRAKVLIALVDGRALPASTLAREAGVAPSTASAHLQRLLAAGVLAVEEKGRNRWYRIDDHRVVTALEALMALAEVPAPTGLTGHQRMRRLRVARTCYDHLAGALGTDVLAGLLELDALRRTDGRPGNQRGAADRPSSPVADAPYALGTAAAPVLSRIGIDVAHLGSARRPLLRACVDWTEQRHHLAGGLGAAVLDTFLEMGWVARRPEPRELTVREPERIREWLGTPA